MQLDEQHSGRSIDVECSEVVAVHLKENPTTGYRWTIENADGLDLEADRNSAANAPGAAGIREFLFRAKQPGSHELRLKNWREWEGDKSVIGRFAVRITVR